MRTVKFYRDTNPSREGGPGYKAGDIVQLKDASARRWISRNAAEYVRPDAPVAAAAEPEAPVVAAVQDVQQTQEETVVDPIEGSDGNGVEGAPDVEGADGGDSGERAQHEPGRRRGRPRTAVADDRGQ